MNCLVKPNSLQIYLVKFLYFNNIKLTSRERAGEIVWLRPPKGPLGELDLLFQLLPSLASGGAVCDEPRATSRPDGGTQM